jgi:hypothetical protein
MEEVEEKSADVENVTWRLMEELMEEEVYWLILKEQFFAETLEVTVVVAVRWGPNHQTPVIAVPWGIILDG